MVIMLLKVGMNDDDDDDVDDDDDDIDGIRKGGLGSVESS